MYNFIGDIYNEMVRAEKEPSISHYPSGVCAVKDKEFIGKCRRALYYRFKGIKQSNPIEPSSLFKMEVGNTIHDFMDKLLDSILAKRDDVESTQNEVEVKWQESDLGFPFSGRLDKVVKFKNGEVVGFEWKSTYGAGITDIQKNGVKLDALLQCICYLSQSVIPINMIYIYYIGRDNGFIYAFEITKIEGGIQVAHLNSSAVKQYQYTFENIKEPLLALEGQVKNSVIPDRDYKAIITSTGTLSSKGDWQCRYCQWANECWGL